MNEFDSLQRNIETERRKTKRPLQKYGWLLLTILALVAVYFLTLGNSPSEFPVGATLEIEEGSNAKAIVQKLKDERYIRSELYAHMVLSFDLNDAHMQAGRYQFTEMLTTENLLLALTKGEYKLPPIRITIPEGLRGSDIDDIANETLGGEDTLVDAEIYDEYIGYLFPDTYFVPESFTEAELITLMRERSGEVLADYSAQIEASTFTLDEILILASILEREANSEESMHMVAGVLMNRLDIGMALQVDATLDYLLNKESSELTLDDLEIDSPYNTYEYPGLPPAPIANPGRTAIEAVLSPTQHEYLYYLTDNDGTFHYATTFEAHKLNKERYLR